MQMSHVEPRVSREAGVYVAAGIGEFNRFTMPVRGKRVSNTAKTIILYVFSYFEQQSQKSKAKGPPRLMDKTE